MLGFRGSFSQGLDQGAGHIRLALADQSTPSVLTMGRGVCGAMMCDAEHGDQLSSCTGQGRGVLPCIMVPHFPAACAEDHLTRPSRALARRPAMMSAGGPAPRCEALLNTKD